MFRGPRQIQLLRSIYPLYHRPYPFLSNTPCTCKSYRITNPGYLILILVGLVVDDVEEAELVHALGGRDNAEPVTELLLLEELLGTAKHQHCTDTIFGKYSQVLQVAAGELLVGNDLDLAVTLLGDLDVLAEVTGAALNLDAVVKELLESLEIEDLVVDGLRAVDDELLGDLLALLGRGAGGALLHGTLAYCSVRGSTLLNQADSKAVYVRWQAF